MSARYSNIAYFLSFVPIYLFLKLSALLPFRTRVWLGGVLISGFVRWFPPARQRILSNLEIVRPGASRSEGLKLCAGVGRQLGRTITEILFGEEFQTKHGPFLAKGPGLEVVSEAQAEGRPVLLVSAHFGQWDAVRMYLREAHGITVGAIYRPNNNPYYDPYFTRGAAASGTPLVPKNAEGFRALLKHLKAGGAFAFLADQVYHKGVRLPFLGEEALTTMSPAQLALAVKAPLIPAYALRCADDQSFEILFEAPIPPSDPETMMRAFNDSASRMIEAHPDQWLWPHRRWK